LVTAYKIGYSAENDLFNRMLDIDFIGRRSYKSQGPFDLMMIGKKYRPLLIEVKYYKQMIYELKNKENAKVLKRLMKKVNTSLLIREAKKVDAYPLLAFKIRRKGYLFYRLDRNIEMLVAYKGFNLDRVLDLPPKF
jgi:hypothetical protein